ncbi:type II secretion system protein [Candidatus Dependentiae bacterium]|nr:type II secretion system protein [Candidatus Dependentiae bacterium]
MESLLRFKKESGFTLIETLIGIFLLLMVFIPVLSFLNSISNNLKSNDVIDSALILCSNIVEEEINKFENSETLEDRTFTRNFNDYIFKVEERIRVEGELTFLEVSVEHEMLKEKIKLYRILW